MKYEIKTESVEKKLPEGFQLPASFDAFVAATAAASRGDLGWYAIKYTSPKSLAGFDPNGEVVPMLRLPDGGFVAFWFCNKRSPAIVWFDSEGARKLVGATWSDFLSRLSARKTGVPDLDDREVKQFPSIRGVPKTRVSLTEKRRHFKKWLKEHQPDDGGSGKGSDKAELSEQLRVALCKHFKRDLAKDKVYNRVNLYVTLTSRSYSVQWADYGIKPYPKSKSLRPILQQLVEFLGRSLKKSDITITGDGCVFVEGNICLGNPKLYKF